mmetsp:Transcript_14490/g.25970  ORF Transcript_14490/g.25970 Transcript_14490/m.25970 type:complete len:132 (+) Transcript_14490:337-732(+)
MRGERVPGAGEVSRGKVVKDRSPTPKVHHTGDKSDLYNCIKSVPGGEGLRANKNGSEGVEPGLVEHEEELARNTGEKLGFKLGRKIGVHPISALELVVLIVVVLETDKVRHQHGQVGKDTKELVRTYSFES